jgi:hypothetical protein
MSEQILSTERLEELCCRARGSFASLLGAGVDTRTVNGRREPNDE